MSTRFKRFISTFLLIAALTGAAGPVAVSSAETTGLTGADGTELPTDSATDAPMSMTPEQLAALQGVTGITGLTGDTSTDDDKGFFDKVSDFVTDNAPFIIIGIVVLAAILAGIFIMRGRSKDSKAPKAAAAAGAPASVPSASEIRRRKRAAMQRSREEERLRRKAGLEGRQAVSPTATLPLSANLPADPVEAEKQSARDQLQAAAAVARSGPVPAPVSPTQTAPAAGVIQSVHQEPDTAFTSPTPTPAELSAATAAAMANAPQQETPAPAPVEPHAEGEYPTQVYDLPSDMDESPVESEPMPEVEPELEHEPAIEAPGLDATVGEAAAAFTAGVAGGGLAAKAASGHEDESELADAGESADPADDAARDAEQRLKAKVAEIKAEQGRIPAAPVPPAPIPAVVEPEPEPEPEPVAEERLDEPEDIQPEIAAPEEIPPTPTGLAAVEQRLQANSDERDRTLREAEERLERIEQRAQDAEKRAAFAERLAQLKIDESERERRLNEVITGIDRAEERAIEAEERAKAAEEAASAALEESTLPPSRLDSFRSPSAQAKPAAQAYTPPPAPEPPAYTPPPADDPDEGPPPVAKSPLFGGGLSGAKSSSGTLNLNSATFEELRDADLSVTQATRILAYRERFGGYRSVEDLEKVPGFPAELIESLRGRITV